MTEQTENLSRVRNAIAKHVEAFLERNINREFHSAELHSYVAERVMITPGSADRIMRDMRAKGIINYELKNRRKSLYVALPVRGQLQLFR
jgi:ribosomal protein S25